MRKPGLSDIRIIRANINLEPLDRIAARHGFEAIRDPIKRSTWERVHQFGENILFFLLALACNPRVCDSKQLKRSAMNVRYWGQSGHRNLIAPCPLQTLNGHHATKNSMTFSFPACFTNSSTRPLAQRQSNERFRGECTLQTRPDRR